MAADGADPLAQLLAFGVSPTDIVLAVKAKVAHLSDVPEELFKFRPLHGGMSNLMFIVEAPSNSPSPSEKDAFNAFAASDAYAVTDMDGMALSPKAPVPSMYVHRVIARLLSPQLDAIIDRDREQQIVSFLSTTGIGPRLFGTSVVRRASDSADSKQSKLLLRIEEFIEGRTLGIVDLRANLEIAASMARKVSRLHKQRPHLRGEMKRQLSDPEHFHGVSSAPSPLSADTDVQPAFNEQLQRYLKIISRIRGLDLEGGGLTELLNAVDWSSEISWCSKLMQTHGGPVVLSHGDLQEGNWIQGHANHKLYLIDYEYACYNYRGFDIGNLFCEHTFDYSVSSRPGFHHDTEAYPSVHWQTLFATEYMNHVRKSQGKDALSMPESTSSAPDNLSYSPSIISGVSDESEIQQLLLEARLGVIASHLYWAMWSAVMAAGKLGINLSAPAATMGHASVASGHSVFEYHTYGLCRMMEYKRLQAALRAARPDWWEECPAPA